MASARATAHSGTSTANACQMWGPPLWLLPQAGGRGLARLAVEMMIRSVVAGMGLRSLVLDIEPGNTASLRLAERLGAERGLPSRSSQTVQERREPWWFTF